MRLVLDPGKEADGLFLGLQLGRQGLQAADIVINDNLRRAEPARRDQQADNRQPPFAVLALPPEMMQPHGEGQIFLAMGKGF